MRPGSPMDQVRVTVLNAQPGQVFEYPDDIRFGYYEEPAQIMAQTTQDPTPVIVGDSAERKSIPLATGVLDYFPAALVEVARVSKAGNDKHNPGEPLHHSRGKSTDHRDSIARHLIDAGGIDPDTGMLHSAELAWRALANLQQELEDKGLAVMPRGARFDPAPQEYNRNPPRVELYDRARGEGENA